jgi:hypothetical protein
MSLASSPLEPLVLADGTKIDPVSGKVIKADREQSSFVEIPSASEAQEIVARTRRSIAEIPLPVGQMNVVSLCLLYTLYGLSNADIAVATRTTVDQVKAIKLTPEYKDISKAVQSSILEHEANDIRGFFQQKSRKAAEKIVAIADEDEGVLGFKASQDILDRAGHRPADVVEHRHRMENALQIEYVKKSDPAQLPVLDLAPEDYDADRS